MLGLIFIVISNFFSVYQSRFVGLITDLAAGTFDDNPNQILLWAFRNQSPAFVVVVSAVCIILFAFIKGFFMFYMRQTIIVMSRHVEFDQKNDIYEHYQKLSANFFKKNSTGDLMTRISEDVSKVRNYTGPAIMYFFQLVTMYIIILIIMLGINWQLTLVVLSPLPILAILIYFVNKSILQKSNEVQSKLSRLSSYAQESFSGIRVIKSFGISNVFTQNFTEQTDDYKKAMLDLVKVEALFFPIILLLIGLSTILTIWVGGYDVINGTLSPGVIAEFIMYVNMLTWPTATLGWLTSIIQQAKASQLRINEFLHTEPEIKNPAPNVPYKPQGNIKFDHVSFQFEHTGIIALNEVSFEIKQGERIGITGRTGSGKTTLTHLLLRLYDPTSGEIRIDGKLLSEVNLDAYRQEVGYVPQEVLLFSDTISNNIRFGAHREVSMEEIRHAAKLAGILESIDAFPLGFETKIGERGVKLSGGQKQRISIARALIKNPNILLMDDCLSAVDAETEDIILANLDSIMEGRTSIFVSHRVSALKKADWILVLDQGKVVQKGKPDQLIEQDGYFKDIYQKQLGVKTES
ncbi:MAG TPA: ABC transporter ATP-binding protein [Bacteroidia bacterium]